MRLERDAIHQQALDQKLKELDTEKEKAQEERDRAEQLRAAFNADKKALMDRMQELEGQAREKEKEANDVKRRVSLMEQNDH